MKPQTMLRIIAALSAFAVSAQAASIERMNPLREVGTKKLAVLGPEGSSEVSRPLIRLPVLTRVPDDKAPHDLFQGPGARKRKQGVILLAVVTPLLAVATISAIVGFDLHARRDHENCDGNSDEFCGAFEDLEEQMGILFSAAVGGVAMLTTIIVGEILYAKGTAAQKALNADDWPPRSAAAGPSFRLALGPGILSLNARF